LKEGIVRNIPFVVLIIFTIALCGCETVRKAGETTGEVVGEGANTLGTVTEGGAGAVQGEVTSEENPYGR
jgi:hypothetical protein